MRKFLLFFLLCPIHIAFFFCSCSKIDNMIIEDGDLQGGVICKVLNDSLILAEGTMNCIRFQLQITMSNDSFVPDSLCQVGFKYLDGNHTNAYYHIECIEEDNSGYYRVYFKDDSIAKNYKERIVLSFHIKTNQEWETIESKPFWIVYSDETGVPVLYIDTPGNNPIVDKDNWVDGASVSLQMPNGSISVLGKTSIKGRGNSTWTMPKKPYALKFEEKVPILGMPANKRWVLLANWIDRTLLRNATAFEISRQTSLMWTPKGEFVDVVLNGVNIGNYYLCEQIRIDKSRVNINKMSNQDIDCESITGGYLLELDLNYDEVNKFKSEYRELPYMIKQPDEKDINNEPFLYIKSYINNLEASLFDKDRFLKKEYLNYLDIESLIDWWFVHELSENYEPKWPKSSYFYKDKSGKLTAGPVWDFDHETFLTWNDLSYSCKEAVYLKELFEDALFVQNIKKQWIERKDKFEQVPQFVRKKAEEIRLSEAKNHLMWPITMIRNKDEQLSFDSAVECLIKAYMEKLLWLDKQITQM